MLNLERLDRIYSLDEITLIPKAKTDIKSRADINPFDENGKLPLFVSPMTCLLDVDNYDTFNRKTYAVLPVFSDLGYLFNARNLSNGWFAVTLEMFRRMVEGRGEVSQVDRKEYFICIDTANGHMEDIYELVPRFKEYHPNVKIMAGNIANSHTYEIACNASVDYVRVGIGGGNGCLTSAITGMHYGLVNLLSEISSIRERRKSSNNPKFVAKVIADGGIDTMSKAIKCIALGADYVMMGKMFAMCEESRGRKCYARKMINSYDELDYDILNFDDDADYRAYCLRENVPVHAYTRVTTYYGQSSAEGQLDRFGCVKSEPEGCKVFLPVKYTYTSFCNKFEAALRSAMSYNGSRTLSNFRDWTNIGIQTISEFNSYNK